jgi:hypothetical protein
VLVGLGEANCRQQAVADIIDNALLIRFKLTARPGHPAMVQREAVKRTSQGFSALGFLVAKEGATVNPSVRGAADAHPATAKGLDAQRSFNA